MKPFKIIDGNLVLSTQIGDVTIDLSENDYNLLISDKAESNVVYMKIVCSNNIQVITDNVFTTLSPEEKGLCYKVSMETYLKLLIKPDIIIESEIAQRIPDEARQQLLQKLETINIHEKEIYHYFIIQALQKL